MAAPPCEYKATDLHTLKEWIFMVCELYPNKAAVGFFFLSP